MVHNIQFAWKMIQKRPLRMGLTLLQIALGVASVTLVLCFVFSTLYGSQAHNPNLLRVEYAKEEKMENGVIYSAEPAFSATIVENVRKRATYLDGLTVLGHQYGSYIDYEGIRYRTGVIYGVNAGFAEMVRLKLSEGSFFSEADVQSRTSVAVISEEANRQLFGAESGIGKKLHISDEMGLSQELEIIGIYTGQKQLMSGGLYEAHFFVPYSTLSSYAITEKGGAEPSYEWLLATAKPGKLAEAKEEMNQLFEHELRSSGYKPQQSGMGLVVRDSNQDDKELRREVVTSFGLFMGSFAFISLVISSIGILSVMMVSIVERTREIGLRRALGASRISVVGQILSESVFLALAGGILGLILALIGIEPVINGMLFETFFGGYLGFKVYMSFGAVLVALGSVVLVGLIAGLYPGLQAARLSPVEAVREG